MTFRDLFFKKEEVKEQRSCESNMNWFGGSLQFNSQTSYHQNKALQHSAVFRCVDLISSSLAQLPVVVNKVDEDGYKETDSSHITFTLLNKRPNRRQDKFTFIKCIVMSMLLNGNAYVLIKRGENGQIEELQFIPSDLVTVTAKDILSDVYYTITGIKKQFTSNDIIHLINIPDREGIRGISTLQYAKKILTLGFDELDTADAFYRSGNNKAGVIKSEKPITDEQEQQILNRWGTAFGGTNGTPNGICILKPGLSYESIQVSPADAELLDSRKFSIQEIARFFGVPLSMMLDNSNNSYSSVEAENLAFLTSTLAPMLDKIERGFNNKLWNDAEQVQGYTMKFDTSVILRVNKQALGEYYTKLTNVGVLSINEVRKDLDLSPIESGDIHTVQVNLVDINKLDEVNYKKNDNRLTEEND